MHLEISERDKDLLLKIARASIERQFHSVPDVGGLECQERLGAFVTLKRQGMLRGCIGRMMSDLPLEETIAQMAMAAAFEDPRFEPVEEKELPSLTIEISILGALERIHDPTLVEVGRHGLYIHYKGMSGVLLPQVAVEYGWDRLTFLDQVCRKAGLRPGSWKSEDAIIHVFEGLIFGEV